MTPYTKGARGKARGDATIAGKKAIGPENAGNPSGNRPREQRGKARGKAKEPRNGGRHGPTTMAKEAFRAFVEDVANRGASNTSARTRGVQESIQFWMFQRARWRPPHQE